MHTLSKLEKNKTFWFLLGISALFFFLRIPSLIEPYWYGDEGIYQVIGKALIDGRSLYNEIWDNKPPLLYLVYAFFGSDQFSVRFFSLIVGIMTTLLFFKLSLLILENKKLGMLTTFIFALLFASPILEGNIANAENFMLLPIIASAILFLKHSDNPKLNLPYTKISLLALAGFLIGIAFLFKTVAFFDLLAFSTFLAVLNLPRNFSFAKTFKFWKKSRFSIYTAYKELKNISANFLPPALIGFSLPLLLTIIYFFANNNLSDFAHAVFFNNIDYVGYENKLLIPQGFLVLKIFLLVASLVFTISKKRFFSKVELFVLFWLLFSLFNSNFSGRPYAHYALLLLPSWSLLLGLLLKTSSKTIQIIFLSLMLLISLLISIIFKPNYIKSFNYYGNTMSFVTGEQDTESFRSFFDEQTPRDYEIASFIKSRALPGDNIFIWGDSPQIYVLSEKLPLGKYTVSYHINENPDAVRETNHLLENSKPKYIIILDEARTFPFDLSSFKSKFIFAESAIYERNY